MDDRRHSVFVVDDDARTTRLLAKLLTEDGFSVETATDGAAAIARLSREPPPDVLITDLRMPFADGLSVARYARAQKADMPIFIVTGYPELVARIDKLLVGVAQVFPKPLAYPELTTAMRNAFPR